MESSTLLCKVLQKKKERKKRKRKKRLIGNTTWQEDDQTLLSRGSKSRNKVSIGEPAEGSLMYSYINKQVVVTVIIFYCFYECCYAS